MPRGHYFTLNLRQATSRIILSVGAVSGEGRYKFGSLNARGGPVPVMPTVQW